MNSRTEVKLFEYLDNVVEPSDLEGVVANIKELIKNNSYIGQAREFHEVFEADDDKGYNPDVLKHRVALMFEELTEIVEASGQEAIEAYIDLMKAASNKMWGLLEKTNCNVNPVEILDGLADLQYVLSGTVVAIGIPNFDEAYNVVHKNNMEKQHETYTDAQRAANCKATEETLGEISIYPNDGKYILKIKNKVIKPNNHPKVDLTKYV